MTINKLTPPSHLMSSFPSLPSLFIFHSLFRISVLNPELPCLSFCCIHLPKPHPWPNPLSLSLYLHPCSWVQLEETSKVASLTIFMIKTLRRHLVLPDNHTVSLGYDLWVLPDNHTVSLGYDLCQLMTWLATSLRKPKQLENFHWLPQHHLTYCYLHS